MPISPKSITRRLVGLLLIPLILRIGQLVARSRYIGFYGVVGVDRRMASGIHKLHSRVINFIGGEFCFVDLIILADIKTLFDQ